MNNSKHTFQVLNDKGVVVMTTSSLSGILNSDVLFSTTHKFKMDGKNISKKKLMEVLNGKDN